MLIGQMAIKRLHNTRQRHVDSIRYDSYVLVLCYIIGDTPVTAPNVMLAAGLMWSTSYSNPVGHGHITIFQKSAPNKSF